jgi:hypothetical protein
MLVVEKTIIELYVFGVSDWIRERNLCLAVTVGSTPTRYIYLPGKKTFD